MENQSLPVETTAQQEDSVNLRHYWHVILERRWLVITAFISIFALTLIYVFKAPRIYQATARLQIDREQENLLRMESVSFTTSQEESTYLQTQYKNLISRSLIQSVVSTLKLADDERYKKKPDVVRAVAEDITVVPIRLSRLVDVKVEHPDRKKASDIANTLVENFKDQNLDRKTKASLAVVNRLKTEAEGEEKKLDQAQKDLQQYAEAHQQVSFEESGFG